MLNRSQRRFAPALAPWIAASLLFAASLLLIATPAMADADLIGPLRVRDMTPFNLLRLDMLPAHAVEAGRGSWAIEGDLSFSNTFVMSENVRRYLQARGGRAPLTQADADAILALGEDAYYVDGEFGLLETTFHYRVARRTSLYMTLSAYDFSGGFMDGSIEGFHEGFGLENGGRDSVSRNLFQTVLSFDGSNLVSLEPAVNGGLGDPVLGLRQVVPLGQSRFSLVVSGEAKIALGGERLFLSTGTNDYGLQVAAQGKFRRQAFYAIASFVSTDGQVLGIALERRVIPTLIAAWEVGLTAHANFIGQLYASRSTLGGSTIGDVGDDKYQASFGIRGRRGRFIYGAAVTENLKNFDNTPDVGLSLTLAWAAVKS